VYPDWLTAHHTWSSLDSTTLLHINSGEKSFRLSTFGYAATSGYATSGSATSGSATSGYATTTLTSASTASAHLTCQDLLHESRNELLLVSYLRSGCDSGYLCTRIRRAAPGALYLQLGGRSRVPAEACSDLYTAPWPAPPLLLVARGGGATTPLSSASCGLAGRYSLAPLNAAASGQFDCRHGGRHRRPESLSLTAGCGSGHLVVEAKCGGGGSLARAELRCHAHWSEGEGGGVDHRLVVSSMEASSGGAPMICITHRDE
jgi:hypothetical protein